MRIGGRGCAAAPVFAADRSVTLPLQGGEELRVDLHPRRGHVRILPTSEFDDTPLDALVEAVDAPPDERLLTIRLGGGGRFTSLSREIVIELHTNQWNAIVVGEDRRIVSVLNARMSGDRSLRAGAPYLAPRGEPRFGADPDVDRGEARVLWESVIAESPEEDRLRRLLGRFAWTGAINGEWILGSRADGRGFEADAAFDRWWWIRGLPEPRPTVLRFGGRLQPYPVALAGIPGEPCPSLLAAMDRVAGEEPAEAIDGTPEPDARRAAKFTAARLAAVTRRLERLRAELADAEGTAGIRAGGDLLLARLHQVRRGESVARLEDWDGGTVEIEIDPRLTPAENAARLYDEARRRERAAARLPGLIEGAEAEEARWRGASVEIGEGRVPEWVQDRLSARDAASGPASSRRAVEESLPYRVFRTSGGLEVRVGRGAKENDRLTFRESAPHDVWLHASSAPGSHVILRWSDPNASPPARDLEEAAQLAAVFSRARTSSVAPVDWTRRRHVTKPRGAAPGLVIPRHARTLFVEPDATIVERLAVRE